MVLCLMNQLAILEKKIFEVFYLLVKSHPTTGGTVFH